MIDAMIVRLKVVLSMLGQALLDGANCSTRRRRVREALRFWASGDG